jgi:hypothetical protein
MGRRPHLVSGARFHTIPYSSAYGRGNRQYQSVVSWPSKDHPARVPKLLEGAQPALGAGHSAPGLSRLLFETARRSMRPASQCWLRAAANDLDFPLDFGHPGSHSPSEIGMEVDRIQSAKEISEPPLGFTGAVAKLGMHLSRNWESPSLARLDRSENPRHALLLYP